VSIIRQKMSIHNLDRKVCCELAAWARPVTEVAIDRPRTLLERRDEDYIGEDSHKRFHIRISFV